MRVLLVSANQEKIPYPVTPLGLLYIAQSIQNQGVEVSILDLCFSNNISKDIKETLKSFKPDFIGVSIRNVDNLSFPGSVSYLPAIRNIVEFLKRNTDAPVALGGSAFSLFPEDILKFMNCELGIVGEGEVVFGRLLKEVDSGNYDFDTVDNLIRISGNEVSRNRLKCAMPENSVLSRDLVDNRLYAECGGMGNIQTKRGCKFKCSYCTYPFLEGSTYRLRQPEIIAEEVRLLKEKYGTNHVFFVDNVFNYPTEHAAAVCEAIIRENVEVGWSCFAYPHRLSGELLALMKKAGCTHIEFGSDALSDKILSKLRKPFSVDDIMYASAQCRKAGIKCAHYVIFGGPGETIDSLQHAFKNIGRLETNAVIAMIGIRIYPKTQLEELSIKEGIIPRQQNLLEPHFYLSPEIPVEAVLREVSEFTNTNSHCIVPGMGIRSSDRMFKALRKRYQEGPLWGYLRA